MPIQNYITQNGKQDVVKFLSSLILLQAQFFNTKQTFNQIQAVVCAGDLIERYSTETFEDFLMMFKLARQAQFDKVWRLDSEVLFGWMQNYLELKYEKIEELERKRKSTQNDILAKTNLSPESKKQLDEFHKAFTERHKKKKKESEPSPINHHQIFIEKLPELCKRLSDAELSVEIDKAKNAKLFDAVKIYEKELNDRKTK